MHQHPPGASREFRARLVTLLALFAVAGFATFALSWLWRSGARPTGERQPQLLPDIMVAAEPTSSTSIAPEAEPEPLQRSASEPPPPAPEPTFEERIEQLVTIGTRTAELARDDEYEAAKTSDQEARCQFQMLLDRFEDAGERGLAMLAGLPDQAAAGTTIDPADAARRIVLQLVLATECARRHAAAEQVADHRRIDPLVQALLDVMPQSEPIADTGGHVLADRPYLRATHEPTVLLLVQLAGDGRFPRPIATRLLLTLWDNLQRSGERSSDELSRLAMLLLADADPSKRTAACRQLLGDTRYRAMVLAWLREHADKTVAAEIAGIAAQDLPPAEALAVLRELGSILQRAPNAYMVLGARAPEVLADAYRELLAANTQPDIRRDLIAGVGFAPAGLGLEITQFALQNDPSPEVRIQCAFALTASSGAEIGERALNQLLDDPVIAHDSGRLGALVLAMHNLEAAGCTNALDRLGQRLRTMPLSESSRQSLEALLARCLPDGRVSTGR